MRCADKSANYAVKVNGVEILPDPVVRGEPFTFKIAAYTGNYTSLSLYWLSLLKWNEWVAAKSYNTFTRTLFIERLPWVTLSTE